MELTVGDVMTRTVVVAAPETRVKEIARILHEYRVSALPVVESDRVLGVVSEDDLLLKEDPGFVSDGLFSGRRRKAERAKAGGLVAAEVMSAPAVTIGPLATHRQAARLMHRERVKRLPVVDERGRILGIISRSDLIGVLLRDDGEIGREICEDVIARALWLDPAGFIVRVTSGVVQVTGQVTKRSLASVLVDCIKQVDGVIGVQARITWAEDDLQGPEVPLPWTGLGVGREDAGSTEGGVRRS